MLNSMLNLRLFLYKEQSWQGTPFKGQKIHIAIYKMMYLGSKNGRVGWNGPT